MLNTTVNWSLPTPDPNQIVLPGAAWKGSDVNANERQVYGVESPHGQLNSIRVFLKWNKYRWGQKYLPLLRVDVQQKIVATKRSRPLPLYLESDK